MIDGVILHPLRQFADDRGRTMHMLRRDDPHFSSFGEVYFSGVQQGKVKGWYRHREKTLNLAVPAGTVRFVLFDDRPDSPTRGQVGQHLLGEEEALYALLTVPPHLWYGFQGVAAGVSMIANCTDLPNDPAESERKPTDSSDIPYRWSDAT